MQKFNLAFGADRLPQDPKAEKSDLRIFSAYVNADGRKQWFCQTEHGVIGPYESKIFAQRVMADYCEFIR